MKYRNTKTDVVIDVKSKIIGGYWQAIEPAKTTVETTAKSTSRKKAVKKECNTQQ